MFQKTMMGGASIGAPDACKTPTPPVGQPVPIPYVNVAVGCTVNPATTADTVLCVGMPTINQLTKGTISNGNQAGVYMGVASSQVMGPNSYILGSLVVMKEGAPAQRLTSLGTHNGLNPNCPGVTLVPSQVTVLVLA